MNYVSLSEAAKRLGKSRQWLWVLIQMKRLKAVKIGNQYVIAEEDIKKPLPSMRQAEQG